MKRFLIITISLLTLQVCTFAQFQQVDRRQSDDNGRSAPPTRQPQGQKKEPKTSEQQGGQQPIIPREVKNWQLADGFSRADTIAVDTISTGFQIYNPIYERSIANVFLSNLGSPAQSMIIEDMPRYNEFIFARNLQYWLTNPNEWEYYNTRTPYTNLYYQHSGPKRRSEENVGALFTQNINPNLNVGFHYKLISSVGKYEAQKAENRFLRLFSSYSGPKYNVHGSFMYGKTDHFESGGILNDDYIFNPQKYEYGQPETIPVIFMDATSRIDNTRLFVDQKLKIGKINVATRDTSKATTPLATLSHTFDLNRYGRTYSIDDLSQYFSENGNPAFYEQRMIDGGRTRDSVYHTTLRNTVQLKFNEEANPFLQFGMRVYLMHETEHMRWPGPSEYQEGDGDGEEERLIYHQQSEQRNATALGGQLFKNLGSSFFYDGGIRIWFQGHKAGDSQITGSLNSRFRIRQDTAGLFGQGGIFLTSPGFFTEQYYSNHYDWNKRFSPVKTIKIRGGVTIPTRQTELSVEVRLIDDHVFWNEQALPEQTNKLLNLVQFKLKTHLILGNIHSRNEVVYQITSHNQIIPVPETAIFTSNYYENTLFQVLFFQLGFDLRYHTKYYAPDYMPATGQFFIQRERKTGNYPVIDPFVNFHLKRANIFIKYDHLNQGIPNNNYFHTIGYPVNPRGIRFGLSWNFYD
jgi:hypothetical protein